MPSTLVRADRDNYKNTKPKTVPKLETESQNLKQNHKLKTESHNPNRKDKIEHRTTKSKQGH